MSLIDLVREAPRTKEREAGAMVPAMVFDTMAGARRGAHELRCLACPAADTKEAGAGVMLGEQREDARSHGLVWSIIEGQRDLRLCGGDAGDDGPKEPAARAQAGRRQRRLARGDGRQGRDRGHGMTGGPGGQQSVEGVDGLKDMTGIEAWHYGPPDSRRSRWECLGPGVRGEGRPGPMSLKGEV